MNLEIASHTVDDIPGFAARGQREIVDILPHHGAGKDVVDTVLSVPTKGLAPDIFCLHVDDFTDEDLQDALTHVDQQGFDVFKVIPHRHGARVRLSVYGVSPRLKPPSVWHVVRASDY